VMITTPTSIDNKTTKVKRPREDGFCVFLFFFCPGLILWWVLFFYAFVKFNKKNITKNLVLIFKLSTIENFYYIQNDFATILVFLGSCHNLREITKEKE
jgi:hypothetical protein